MRPVTVTAPVRGMVEGTRESSVTRRGALWGASVTAVATEVTRALARVELPASALILEITETSLMADPERAIVALERLRQVGVRLSVDDLGTGYSSLAYLQRLPVDEIKIDRSFLDDFSEPSAQAVVGTIVDLGHRLGKQVVAEGDGGTNGDAAKKKAEETAAKE